MRVEPIIEISGDLRSLHHVEFFNDWSGFIVIRSEWSIGEPVPYAPRHCEQERLPFDQAAARINELLAELDFAIF